MMRLLFPCVCIISLTFLSCNNNEVKTDHSLPEPEKQLRNLITRYPDSILLKENLIQYFRDQGNYGQAIAETAMDLKKDSLNARFLVIKATLYFENGDTLHAIKSFEKAVSINPKPEYIISLGSLYAQTKNPLALSMADTILHLRVENAPKQALFIKGMYYTNTGDKIKAIGFFNNCLKLDYRDVLAYREKAICLYDLNKYTDALKELEKAVAVKKTFDEGYYWMGRCYEKLNKTKEAIGNYQLALQIDPGYEEAKEALVRLGIK